MFRFKICALDEADALINDWATKCVTMLGPQYKHLYKSTPNRLVVLFDDIAFIPKPGSKLVAPSIKQIASILQFTKTLTESDRLLVHCKAGISRSPAMLIGILCQHGMNPKAAFDQVQTIRPQLWPNSLIVKMCDKLLELDFEITRVVEAFKANRSVTEAIRHHLTILKRQ